MAKARGRYPAVVDGAPSAQCDMYLEAPGGGRCARMTDAGEGLCDFHTRALRHDESVQERDWLWPAESPDGFAAYAEQDGGEAHWRLWSEVGDALEERAASLLFAWRAAARTQDTAAWSGAGALCDMQEHGDLWQLHDMSIGDLARETGYQPKTIKAYILAEQRVRAMGERWRAPLRGLPIQFAINCGQWFAEYSDDELGALVAMGESESVRALIAEGKRLGGAADAEKEEKVAVEVTMAMPTAGSLSVVVKIPAGEHFWRKAALAAARDEFERKSYVVGPVEWPEDPGAKCEKVRAAEDAAAAGEEDAA